jgi:hypothetical protein
VPVDELIDRDAEAAILLERASEGNNSRLVAPRRFGKTSLLRRALHDVQREGWAAVYVDFFGVLTLIDIAQRIERAYAEQLSGRLASWFSGVRRMLRPTVRAGGGPVPGAVEVAVDAQAEPPLLERLALPRRLHERHGQRTLVVFDEFQDVLAAQDRADAIIRSEIQHHGDAAGYIFSGSHLGTMSELFVDPRRAFYGQAGPLELPPLRADEVAEYIAERFERSSRVVGDALDPLLARAEGAIHKLEGSRLDGARPDGPCSPSCQTSAQPQDRRSQRARRPPRGLRRNRRLHLRVGSPPSARCCQGTTARYRRRGANQLEPDHPSGRRR